MTLHFFLKKDFYKNFVVVEGNTCNNKTAGELSLILIHAAKALY